MLTIRYLELETDGSGDATATTGQGISGKLYAIEFLGSGLDSGADTTISITDKGGGVDQTLLTLTDVNSDGIYYVRELAQDNAGGDLTAIYDLPIIMGKVKAVIAAGGANKTAKIIIYYEP